MSDLLLLCLCLLGLVAAIVLVGRRRNPATDAPVVLPSKSPQEVPTAAPPPAPLDPPAPSPPPPGTSGDAPEEVDTVQDLLAHPRLDDSAAFIVGNFVTTLAGGLPADLAADLDAPLPTPEAPWPPADPETAADSLDYPSEESDALSAAEPEADAGGEAEGACGLSDLPLEVQVLILSRLHFRSLCRCARASKSLQGLSSLNEIWYLKCKEKWFLTRYYSDRNWKDFFKQMLLELQMGRLRNLFEGEILKVCCVVLGKKAKGVRFAIPIAQDPTTNSFSLVAPVAFNSSIQRPYIRKIRVGLCTKYKESQFVGLYSFGVQSGVEVVEMENVLKLRLERNVVSVEEFRLVLQAKLWKKAARVLENTSKVLVGKMMVLNEKLGRCVDVDVGEDPEELQSSLIEGARDILRSSDLLLHSLNTQEVPHPLQQLCQVLTGLLHGKKSLPSWPEASKAWKTASFYEQFLHFSCILSKPMFIQNKRILKFLEQPIELDLEEGWQEDFQVILEWYELLKKYYTIQTHQYDTSKLALLEHTIEVIESDLDLDDQNTL